MIELISETNYLVFAYLVIAFLSVKFTSKNVSTLLIVSLLISEFFTWKFIHFSNSFPGIRNDGFLILSIFVTSLLVLSDRNKKDLAKITSVLLPFLIFKLFYIDNIILLLLYWCLLKMYGWSQIGDEHSKQVLINKIKLDCFSLLSILLFVCLFMLSTRSSALSEFTPLDYSLFSLSLLFLLLLIVLQNGFFLFSSMRNFILSLDFRSMCYEIFINVFILNAFFIKTFNMLLSEADPSFQHDVAILVKILVCISIIAHLLSSLIRRSTGNLILFFLNVNLSFAMLMTVSNAETSSFSELFLYLLSLSLSILGLLMIYSHYQTNDKDLIFERSFSGLFYKDRKATLLAIISFLSLVGLPFTAGFTSKYFLVTSLLQENYFFECCLLILSPIVVLPRVVSVISELFNKNANEDIQFYSKIIEGRAVISGVLMAVVIILGFYPKLFF